MNIFGTAAAISTPRGRGGVAMIRLSGGGALGIAEGMFAPRSGRALGDYPPRTAVFGEVFDGATVFDTGVAVYYKAPASYTGEDVVELCVHGGEYIAQRTLETAFSLGAEPAGLGEFTKRAFLNGKLTLAEAEAVADSIDAENETQLALARSQSALSAETDKLYDSARTLAASVGVSVDYPGEGLEEDSRSELLAGAESLREGVAALLATYRAGHAAARGVKTVIAGRPNVGKSSLFNALAGEDKAIVTPTAGTTRDVLETTVYAGGARLLLCDTAGLRESEGIERMGVERALRKLDEAELALPVFDASEPLSAEDGELIGRINARGCEVVAVLGKGDLPAVTGEEELRARFTRPITVVTLSALTGEGVEKLRETVGELYGCGKLGGSGEAVVTNARHAGLLGRALAASGRAVEALRAGEPEDIAALDLEDAMKALGELDGRAVTEEVVSEIFARFCVGK